MTVQRGNVEYMLENKNAKPSSVPFIPQIHVLKVTSCNLMVKTATSPFSEVQVFES